MIDKGVVVGKGSWSSTGYGRQMIVVVKWSRSATSHQMVVVKWSSRCVMVVKRSWSTTGHGRLMGHGRQWVMVVKWSWSLNARGWHRVIIIKWSQSSSSGRQGDHGRHGLVDRGHRRRLVMVDKGLVGR